MKKILSCLLIVGLAGVSLAQFGNKGGNTTSTVDFNEVIDQLGTMMPKSDSTASPGYFSHHAGAVLTGDVEYFAEQQEIDEDSLQQLEFRSLMNLDSIIVLSGRSLGSRVMKVPTTDSTGHGDYEPGVTFGEAMAVGSVVFLKSDMKFWKAKSNAGTTMPFYGIAMRTVGANDTGSVFTKGNYFLGSWNFTVGDTTGIVFVSETTAGALTQTLPATSGNQAQVVGMARATHVLNIGERVIVRIK